MLGHIFTTGH